MERWCQNYNWKFINSHFCACAVKIWLKVALNAVRLPKFEAINGKSWSPRTMVVKYLQQRSMLTWFCACSESCVIFSSGPCTVFMDSSICLNRSAIKVVYWIGKSGSGFQICGENLLPTHRSRNTAHAQWLQTHCQWYPTGDVRTHNSRTDSRRILKLGRWIDHVTCHVWPLTKVKRSNVKVTRSCNVSAAKTL